MNLIEQEKCLRYILKEAIKDHNIHKMEITHKEINSNDCVYLEFKDAEIYHLQIPGNFHPEIVDRVLKELSE